MFSLFKSNSLKKLKKTHSAKLEEAMQAQRRGDIRQFASLTTEAEEILREIKKLSKD